MMEPQICPECLMTRLVFSQRQGLTCVICRREVSRTQPVRRVPTWEEFQNWAFNREEKTAQNLYRFFTGELPPYKQPHRFILKIEGDVEPVLIGPYSDLERDVAAKAMRNASDGEDGIFWLDLDNGQVKVGSYSAGFMEGKNDESTGDRGNDQKA